ncbi:MAG: PIN domain-containing protein [Acidimicrobiia bacterium]|nr:PIN domain-containing protein [Acidimicrobiia bacterium]
MTPRRIFVDTGAWFAAQVVDDAHHQEAASSLRGLIARPIVLVTTNHVVGETYTLLRVTRGYDAGRKFLDSLEQTKRLERVFINQDLERRAFAILDKYRDHDFSFVDATSFAYMRAERIRHAFAFDSHFAVCGFVRVPADAGMGQLGGLV